MRRVVLGLVSLGLDSRDLPGSSGQQPLPGDVPAEAGDHRRPGAKELEDRDRACRAACSGRSHWPRFAPSSPGGLHGQTKMAHRSRAAVRHRAASLRSQGSLLDARSQSLVAISQRAGFMVGPSPWSSAATHGRRCCHRAQVGRLVMRGLPRRRHSSGLDGEFMPSLRILVQRERIQVLQAGPRGQPRLA